MYVLGADIGTEGTKVVLIDRNGFVVRTQYISYQYDVLYRGWTEQHPMVWWNAFHQCVKSLWFTCCWVSCLLTYPPEVARRQKI